MSALVRDREWKVVSRPSLCINVARAEIDENIRQGSIDPKSVDRLMKTPLDGRVKLSSDQQNGVQSKATEQWCITHYQPNGVLTFTYNELAHSAIEMVPKQTEVVIRSS